MSESTSDMISPCLNCPDPATQTGLLLSLVARLASALSGSQATQAVVSVNGSNVTLLSAAAIDVKYRDIQLQNLGTTPVFVRLASGASSTGTNGEFVLNGGASANDGNGGTFEIAGFQGIITGASASVANVSVTVLNIA